MLEDASGSCKGSVDQAVVTKSHYVVHCAYSRNTGGSRSGETTFDHIYPRPSMLEHSFSGGVTQFHDIITRYLVHVMTSGFEYCTHT